MNRIAAVWGRLVDVEEAALADCRVYTQRPPRIETPCVYNALRPSNADRTNQCIVRDQVRVGVVLVIGLADTDQRHSIGLTILDELLDALDTEIAGAAFGADRGTRRTGIGPSADGFTENVLAWEVGLELAVSGTFNPP